jgi:hypothetical protein
MDNLTPFIKRFGIAIVAALAVLVGFLLFGVDQHCTIEIRNGNQSVLSLRTYKFNSRNMRVAIDSIALRYDDTFRIGQCRGCSPPDSMDLDFDAVAMYDSTGMLRFMRRAEFVRFLESNERGGCLTYEVK